MQARMLMRLFITITSFCFGMGKEGIRSLWNEPLDTSDWFQSAQRKALFEWPPCYCQGSPDILHHPGWSCQTSVFKQRLPFRPGQMQVLWYLSESLQSKMRSLSTWECRFCDWRQQSDLRFQNLSLYRPDSIETPPELYWLQCLFLFFSTEFYGSGFPLPPGYEVLWPLCAKNDSWPRRLILGFQTILADTAHNLAQGLLYRLFKAKEPK